MSIQLNQNHPQKMTKHHSHAKHPHSYHPPPPQQHHPHQPPPQNHRRYQPPPPPQHLPPHQPPPPQHHPPRPHPNPPPHYRPTKPPKHRRTKLASCIVATVFLLFIIILISIIYFSLLKPKDPKITITAITLPTFTTSTNSTTVSFTFSYYAAVHNPNHAVFSHFDSTLQLLYAGNQVGFMFIPAGTISAGKTEFMAATLSVNQFPITAGGAAPVMAGNIPAEVVPPVFDGIDRVQPTLELEVRLEMVGRVRVLWFFTHHVESVADCNIAVAVKGGIVLGFHC